mgnify:CR=1 FL=1
MPNEIFFHFFYFPPKNAFVFLVNYNIEIQKVKFWHKGVSVIC